jgi:hypothetical protein
MRDTGTAAVYKMILGAVEVWAHWSKLGLQEPFSHSMSDGTGSEADGCLYALP